MRRCYIVCYDITDDKRLDRVRRTVMDFGARLQFSVYQCELAEVDLVRLREALRGIVHRDEDRVLFIDLGPVQRSGQLPDRVETLGRHPELPDTGSLIF
jgi:CRISPR-associated protein Cas2